LCALTSGLGAEADIGDGIGGDGIGGDGIGGDGIGECLSLTDTVDKLPRNLLRRNNGIAGARIGIIVTLTG
jgi:hypothetical protein